MQKHFRKAEQSLEVIANALVILITSENKKKGRKNFRYGQ